MICINDQNVFLKKKTCSTHLLPIFLSVFFWLQACASKQWRFQHLNDHNDHNDLQLSSAKLWAFLFLQLFGQSSGTRDKVLEAGNECWCFLVNFKSLFLFWGGAPSNKLNHRIFFVGDPLWSSYSTSEGSRVAKVTSHSFSTRPIRPTWWSVDLRVQTLVTSWLNVIYVTKKERKKERTRERERGRE